MSKYSIPLNNLDSELFIPIPLVPVWPQTCGMTWIPETEKSLGHHFNSLSSQPFPFSSCCSVSRSCPTLGNPMDCGTPGSFVFCCLPEFAQIHIHWVSVLSNHFILCHPLLRLPSVFLSIRVFSSELALCIKWPKYWSFSFNFSISPSSEYSGLISFKIDWFDLLAVWGTGKNLLQHHNSKA